MSRLTDWYDKELAKIARAKASDAELARIAGMTLAEFDSDCSQPDPRPSTIPAHIRDLLDRTGRAPSQDDQYEFPYDRRL